MFASLILLGTPKENSSIGEWMTRLPSAETVMSTAAVDIITVWPTQQKLAKHLRLKFHCSKNGLKSRRKVHMQSTNPDRSVKSFPSDLEWAENSQLDWARHDSRSSIIDFVS
eukprot:TRINITY_DN6876_c1_g2_i1.p1 TRINITY_DN6876_c1_g2~~TRINITY_DN6876_c1_g2_i1.p1  ORF type:complete len:112 (-),score=12.52 TRINITY_DN6876_c1_g2_i1:235-570(-)